MRLAGSVVRRPGLWCLHYVNGGREGGGGMGHATGPDRHAHGDPDGRV
jgi:hypothetical protein